MKLKLQFNEAKIFWLPNFYLFIKITLQFKIIVIMYKLYNFILIDKNSFLLFTTNLLKAKSEFLLLSILLEFILKKII